MYLVRSYQLPVLHSILGKINTRCQIANAKRDIRCVHTYVVIYYMQTEATAAVPCIRDESLCSRFSDEGSRLLRFSCFPSAVARSFLCCSVALFPPKQTSTGIVVHTPN